MYKQNFIYLFILRSGFFGRVATENVFTLKEHSNKTPPHPTATKTKKKYFGNQVCWMDSSNTEIFGWNVQLDMWPSLFERVMVVQDTSKWNSWKISLTGMLWWDLKRTMHQKKKNTSKN